MFYMSLIDAIPLNWRLEVYIKKNRILPSNPHEEAIHIALAKTCKPISLTRSKDLYWLLKGKNKENPTCIQKWLEKMILNLLNFNGMEMNIYFALRNHFKH